MHIVLGDLDEESLRVVLSKCERRCVLELAHVNPFVPKLFGRARKNLIFYRGIEHYRFIFLTRCWLGQPHSNDISLNRLRVWDSPHFLIEKIE